MIENSKFLCLPQLPEGSRLLWLAEIVVADNHRQELVDKSKFKYHLAPYQLILD
jgi:hypothetical protein